MGDESGPSLHVEGKKKLIKEILGITDGSISLAVSTWRGGSAIPRINEGLRHRGYNCFADANGGRHIFTQDDRGIATQYEV